MESSTSQTKESKDEDLDLWEIVTGSKSLTTESVKSLLQGMAEESLSLKESESKDDKVEDWYTTLPPATPATPANTPEYTPIPPSYPTATLRRENSEGGELFPIKELKEETTEDVKEEEISGHSSAGEDALYLEYTPADSENEDQSPYEALKVIQYWVYRIAAYVVVIGVVKWVASKVWERMRSTRSVNESK